MRIKYLLNGRLFSDITHFRRIADSWPLDIPFPEVVENMNEIKDEDIFFTAGYLGNSTNLIKNHNPKKVFIFDNAIFRTKGISNFRILSGNLDSLIKNNDEGNRLHSDYYFQKISELSEKFNLDNKNLKNKPFKNIYEKNNLVIEFPWSVPIKNLIKNKDQKELNLFEKKISFLKNDSNTKIYKYFKNGAIKLISKDNIPLYRIYNNLKPIEKYLLNCKSIICPTSSLAILGIINKLNIFISKYNPYSNFMILYPNYNDFGKEKLIYYLSGYISRLNFNINEIYNYLEENNIYY